MSIEETALTLLRVIIKKGQSEEMFKKIIGTVICLTIAAVGIQLPASAAEGYYWLEAENAAVGSGYEIQENASASGGKLLTLYSTKAPADGAYAVSFEFDNDSEGNYDIWFLAGEGNSTSLSKYKWSLNDESKGGYSNSGEANPTVYQHTLALRPQNVKWSLMGRQIKLEAGKNTIDFTIDVKAQAGTRSYINLFDSVVIAPSAWQWQPDSDLVKPEPLPARYAWIELETPSSETRLTDVSSSSASGGKMLYTYNSRFEDNDNDLEKLNYNFSLSESGSYDIWYLGCAANNASAHLSGLYWDVDNEPEATAAYRNENPQGDSLTILKSAGSTSDIPLYWQKMGTKELDKGEHSLNLTYAMRTLAGSVRSFMIWADCAMIVPTEWGWTPPKVESDNILPDFTAGWLAGKYIAEKNFTEDYSSVTKDIKLPESLKNPGACQISFESEKPEVMSNTGIVTRPYFTAEDASFNFNICTSHGGRINKYPVPITVKKLPKYDISPISVVNEAGEECTALASGEKIRASVNMKVNVGEGDLLYGTGTLLMLLYDKAGALKAVSMQEAEIHNEKLTVEAEMTLPEEVDGAKLRVYLLNGMSMANQLTECYKIGN